MSNLQPSYRTALRKALPGQIANSELSNIISRTVESAAGIAFGQPAFRGSGDHGVIVGATFAATVTGAAGSTAPAAATIGTLSAVTGAKAGVYTATCEVGGSATASKWRVEDPDGLYVGTATGNTAFTSTDGVTFTITDAGTDPVPGEAFNITVLFTADTAFVGIAVLDPGVITNASTPDAYQQYQTGSFETMGPIYVTAGATVADGEQAYWNPATGRYTNTVTHIRLANCRFDTSGVDGDIVEISIRLRNA